MPIKLRVAPEPLSGMSYPEPVELIESDASRLLYQEMLSYCRGRINGRSFLISGHRGAGKTTMVAGAYLKTRRRSEIDRFTMRPLLVQLNGTTLLPSVKEGEARETQPGTRPWYESVGQAGAVAQMEAKEALVQITLCLFRALATEVAREFRRKAVVHPVDGRSLSRSQVRDRLELAAQLEVELLECPDPQRLRFFWSRAGLLGATPLSLFPAPFWRKRTSSELDEAGQGLRELVAISAAAEAFRRISGTLKQQDTATQSAEDKRESSLGVDTSGKTFLDALAVLLSGGLVGTGIFAGNGGALPSALGGIATALATAAVFRYQHTRSRARAKSREYSFLFDTSVTTLDRALPILIERLYEAGVAPIFVVDELDKVESLYLRMGGLVRYLKMLVADQAFFCFLTDRAYYEEIRQVAKGMPYPVEYTYFTHRLYVVFTAPDLHDYLERIPDRPASPAPSSGASAELLPGLATAAAAQQVVRSDDEADWAVLSFSLLHKAKMHSLDLHKEVIQICNESGEVLLAPGEVRTRRSFGHEVLLQVAVEMSLDSQRIAARVERSPDFLRNVHDAVYYPSRCWEDRVPLDLSDRARPQFERYLSERMGWGAGRNETVPPCSKEDLALLFDEVRTLAAGVAAGKDSFLASFDRWLADRPDRASAIRDGDGAAQRGRESRRARLDQVVRDALSGAFSDRLLEREGETWSFRWLFDASGNPCPPVAGAVRARRRPAAAAGGASRRGARPDRGAAAPAPVVEPAAPAPAPDWKEHQGLVVSVAKLLVELSGYPVPAGEAPAASGLLDFNVLSTQTGILMTSPAWPVAQRALADLDQAVREGRSAEETDVSCVRDFAAMLSESGEALARALAWGARVGWAARQGSAGERLLIGLRILANALRFGDRRPAEVRDILQRLGASWPQELSPRLVFDTDPPRLGLGAHEDWIAWVRERVVEIADPEKTAPISVDQQEILRQASWKSWLGRLESYFGTGTLSSSSSSPAVADLLCAAAGIGPSLLLDFRLETMTVAAWSSALLAGVTPGVAGVPPELALFALRALGFEPGARWSDLAIQFPNLKGAFTMRAARIASVALGGVASLRVLILRQPQGSLVDSLRPSTACAALSLSLSEVRSRLAVAQGLAKALQLAWIVAEEPVNTRLVAQISIGDVGRVVPLGAKPPAVQRPGGYIVAPTTLEEIASYLGSLAAT